MTNEDITFFGDLDRRPDGKVRSQNPIWADKALREQLNESIESEERRIKRGEIPEEHLEGAQSYLKKAKHKKTLVDESKPRLSDEERDIISKGRSIIAEDLKDMLPTDGQMQTGEGVEPHEEVKMMTEPVYKIKSKEVLATLKAANVKIFKGNYCTRNGMVKGFQGASEYLGEDASVEVLRRPDNYSGQQHITTDKDTMSDRMLHSPKPKNKGGRPKGSKNKPEEKKYKVSM